MDDNQSNNKVVVFSLLGIFILGMAFLFFIIKTFLKPASNALPQETNTYRKEDINKDGAVDQLDTMLIKSSMGCQSGKPCWDKVIGKTVNGDNPIYASDLDLNNDLIVDQNDLQLLEK